MNVSSGQDVRRERIAKGLSARELARLAGVHHRTVGYWEQKADLDFSAYGVRAILGDLGWRITRHFHAGARGGVLSGAMEIELLEYAFGRMPRSLVKAIAAPRVRCKAKTRNGSECRAMSEPNRQRCRFHGGLSTGPKTAAGRKAISQAQRERWQLWRLERNRARQACSKQSNRAAKVDG